MRLSTTLDPRINFTLAERRKRLAEELWVAAARRLPKKLAYWSMIHVGVTYVKSDEVVPDVPFTVVLDRAGKAAGL